MSLFGGFIQFPDDVDPVVIVSHKSGNWQFEFPKDQDQNFSVSTDDAKNQSFSLGGDYTVAQNEALESFRSYARQKQWPGF